MKHKIKIFIVFASLVTSSIYSQKNMLTNAGETNKAYNKKTITTETPKKIRIVKSYHVVENINMSFGGSKRTYTVSHLSMVDKYDLGPNNTRVVTPIYIDIYPTPEYLKKLKMDSINSISKSIDLKKTNIAIKGKKINSAKVAESDRDILNAKSIKNLTVVAKSNLEQMPITNTNKNSIDASIKINKPSGVAYVDLIETYERIAKKGYRSEEVLKKISNAFFYDGEFEKSAKWLEELFKLNTDLEPEYYYRYSKSLSAINQNEKADRMMQIFKEKQRLNQSISELP